ncbi:MAG TPA: TIGR03000 domain-containing protein [Gemmataceae bacterium]|nr:TIGR03000 domain-containing protein [Gemmataceae bacterium]
MLKRWFPVVSVGALALLLTSAGTSRAQFSGGIFGGGAMSPWSGTGMWSYAPNGMGFNYYRPGMYGAGYGGYGYGGMGMSMGMGMGMRPGAFSGGYGVPSSIAMSPMTYIAYSPPVYTSRAPVVAPATGLLPSDQPATIEVVAPTDAVILFDGHKTSQTGAHRLFTTPDLVKGNSYHYMVEATFTQNGKSVTQAQRVQVYAGARVGVVFPASK